MSTTIVVPIYADAPSLLACIASLVAEIGDNTVLLVNDCGPDADDIEEAVLTAIAGDDRFRYERNPANLGFVGACNRAALELDSSRNDILLLNSDTIVTPGFLAEMSAVLHDDPQNGVVCARSNNATIASLPFELRDPGSGRATERTAQLHAALLPLLPRYSVSPVAMGFCFLVRRQLIDEHGLFDDAFSPGYGEENDFCLRMARHGYRSVIANRALVFHVGSASFRGLRREYLRSTHERLLTRRHPEYTALVRDYLDRGRGPFDALADCIEPADATVRVLVDIAGEPGDIRPFRAATIAVDDNVASRVARRHPQQRVVAHSRLRGRWDLAVAVSDGSPDARQASRLARVAPRVLAMNAAGASTPRVDAVIPVVQSAVEMERLVAQWGRTPLDPGLIQERWDFANSPSGYPSPIQRQSARLATAWLRTSPATFAIARRLARRLNRRD